MTNYGPIDSSTFDDCLARGFGRVVLFLREHDHEPFRESILHACGHDLAFDKQCEITREVYLYDVLVSTGQLDFYAERVLDMLKMDDEYLSYTQLYGLAGQMAARGDEHAREVMYEQAKRDLAEGDSTGTYKLIELDGVRGFLFVISEALRHQGGPRDEYYSEYLLLDEAYKQDGVEKVRSVINEAGSSNAALRDYLESIDTQWRVWQRGLRRPETESTLSYATLRVLMGDQARPFKRHEWWRFGKRATAAALERLAQDLKHETNELALMKIIGLFWRREFRGDIAPLLELVTSTDTKLSRDVVRILRKMPDEAIRMFGLDLIKERTHLLIGLDLLEGSGQASEYPFFNELLRSDYSDDDFHEIGISMRAVIERHPSPDAASILEQLYERGRCSMCRWSTVQRMIDCETVPEWVLAEAVFDAEIGTRKMAREWIEGRESYPGP